MNDRPLRVLLYTDAAGVGGAEISLSHLAAHASPDLNLTIAGVAPVVVNFVADRCSTARRLVLPASWPAHLAAFHRLRPDIVHLNCCTPWANAIGLAAALTLPQARVVRVDQLPLRTTDWLTLWRTRLLSLRVDAHVAVGEGAARRMEDFYALGRHSLLSIPNGVPDRPDLVQPPPSDSPLHVGSIGRLDPMKGHDLLIRALAHVEGMHLTILGEGTARSTLEALAAELNVGDRLFLPGWVADPRLRLPQFHLIAQPSRSEGFPLAIVEAMLAARPVIATRVGSVAEAVHPNQTGLLIEKDSLEELIAALRHLSDRPHLLHQFGETARTLALQSLTADRMTTHYETLWQKLLTQPQSSRFRVPRPKD